jgi:hypothetical protein
LRAAYHDELARRGLRDREGLRAAAVRRLTTALDGWEPGRPVFAYGFEDLTAAEWALLEALSGRTEVTVSIPYEPGRVAFASLTRTVGDLAGLAGARIEELAARDDGTVPASLRVLERRLFEDAGGPVELEGAVRFAEGGGTRGTLELVAEEIATLIRSGTKPEAIGIVCDSVERWRSPLEATFAAFGIPVALEARMHLGQTSFGAALLSLLRFAWLEGERRDLFAFLRSPFSGLQRRNVDFVEGRLRGRAIRAGARVEEESEKLRGGPVPQLVALREAATAVEGAAQLIASMAVAAHGLDAPPTGDLARQDLAAADAASRLLREVAVFAEAPLSVEEVFAALQRTTVRPVGSGEPGRVAVVDLPQARTRTFDVVLVLGLEEGSLPRRGRTSPFLSDERRCALGGRGGGRAPPPARACRAGQPRAVSLLHRLYPRPRTARARP